MYCKSCDYPLWNIRARQCPECGEAFKPSQFRFALNAVRFCCPHCDKGYYGTGEDGHLVPRAFECVGCGRRIDMDEMVLQPTEGVDERLTRAERNPWLDEEQRFLKRWLMTAFRGLGTPTWLLRVTPIDSPPEKAWGFAVFTLLGPSIAMIVPFIVLALVFGAMTGGLSTGLVGFGVVSELAVSCGSLIVLALWVVTAHGMLRLGGSPAGGIGRTAHALCYTCAPQLVFIVPCFGLYFGWMGSLWWIVTGGLALATAQKVSGLRAAVAVSVLPLTLAVLLAAWVIWMATGSMTTSFSSSYGGSSEISSFYGPLRRSGQAGAWPGHIGEALLDDLLNPYDFTAMMSATTASDCGVGDWSMADWGTLSDESKQTQVSRAAAALPGDTIAYRVGDFVFTYPGVDPAAPAKGLWLVVEAWDPAIQMQKRQAFISVLLDDGAVHMFSRNTLSAELQSQNALRAAEGLPPLPDPYSVRPERPTTASGDAGPG